MTHSNSPAVAEKSAHEGELAARTILAPWKGPDLADACVAALQLGLLAKMRKPMAVLLKEFFELGLIASRLKARYFCRNIEHGQSGFGPNSVSFADVHSANIAWNRSRTPGLNVKKGGLRCQIKPRLPSGVV
jgi:hypothetical protein